MDPRHTWCQARKDLCIDGNFRFLHVTRLADVIPLRFAVRVRPMQGIFRALVTAAAIPTDSMTRHNYLFFITAVARAKGEGEKEKECTKECKRQPTATG